MELKPCPFCGGEVTLTYSSYDNMFHFYHKGDLAPRCGAKEPIDFDGYFCEVACRSRRSMEQEGKLMGVYIKGMEMPTSCSVCWALDDYGDYPRCRITEEQRGYTFPIREKRMDNCPLVPVPPHGRLIDADALLKGCERVATEYATREYAFSQSAIENAPTIIPAEEGET